MVRIWNASTGEGRAASKVGLSYTMSAKLRQKKKLAEVLPYTDSSVSFLLLTRVTASEDQREIRKQHGGLPGLGTMTKAQKDTY